MSSSKLETLTEAQIVRLPLHKLHSLAAEWKVDIKGMLQTEVRAALARAMFNASQKGSMESEGLRT